PARAAVAATAEAADAARNERRSSAGERRSGAGTERGGVMVPSLRVEQGRAGTSSADGDPAAARGRACGWAGLLVLLASSAGLCVSVAVRGSTLPRRHPLLYEVAVICQQEGRFFSRSPRDEPLACPCPPPAGSGGPLFKPFETINPH